MNRYIDTDKIDWRVIIPTDITTAEEHMIYRARKLVESQPTADVVEVVHGEWIPEPNCYYRCSNCKGHMVSIQNKINYSYCPYCGADMRLKGGTDEQIH